MNECVFCVAAGCDVLKEYGGVIPSDKKNSKGS